MISTTSPGKTWRFLHFVFLKLFAIYVVLKSVNLFCMMIHILVCLNLKYVVLQIKWYNFLTSSEGWVFWWRAAWWSKRAGPLKLCRETSWWRSDRVSPISCHGPKGWWWVHVHISASRPRLYITRFNSNDDGYVYHPLFTHFDGKEIHYMLTILSVT